MGRRVLNRKEMRNDFDAAERRTKDEEEVEDEEEGDEDEDEEEEEGDDAAADESEEDSEDAGGGDDESGDEDDEEAPKKKKKKVVKPKAPPKPKRTRTPKVVRMRVIWGVFNNSNQMVKSFEYAKKADAEAHAAQLMADKRSTHFIQPVKEPIEEKKEK